MRSSRTSWGPWPRTTSARPPRGGASSPPSGTRPPRGGTTLGSDVADRAREVIAAALDRTAAELRATVGEPGRWTWGRIHTVEFREQTLGGSGIGPLEWYFNSGARQVPGANGAIFNNYYQEWRAFPDPNNPGYVPAGLDSVFAVTNGPSYRLTVDMSDVDAGRIVITTGNSGNPFDRHYGDLIDDWATGGTVPLPFSWRAIEADAASTLTLEPAATR